MTAAATPPAAPSRRPRPRPWVLALWLLPWLALAAVLWSSAWPRQFERACWMREWPFEAGCPEAPEGAVPGQPSTAYQQHLQRNIGDSRAFGWLTGALWTEEDARAADVLAWARQLAPNETSVLAIEAQSQLQAQDWDAAAKALITLLERGHTQARPALLGLMTGADDTAQAVLRHLSADSVWLDGFLASLDRSVPASALQPFISAGRELELLRPVTVLGLIDRLKRDGDWLDAYTLWVAWMGEVPPGLYNGGFDRPAMRRGFDWEWVSQPASRRGLRIDQVPAAPRRGSVLELELTGRAALPPSLLSQAMVLPGPRYRLRGQVMIDRLTSREGLVWALRCARGGDRWAQTAPLLDTQRAWAPFELEFEPPAQCAAAVRLQLEPTAPGEARAGMTGTVYFDDLAVEAIEPAGSAQRTAGRRTP